MSFTHDTSCVKLYINAKRESEISCGSVHREWKRTMQFQEGVMYNKQQHKVVILFVKNSGPTRK